ncbi:dihydrolipoamide acetyltransferase family protein [Amycolatopsis pithecellobii]|uniref:Dihydrolipoamide acetyltransferase component of pyruvate dehydrogenase complex n=1 Tax=Amycolatopsis pithecellobii TaxID=664692 RepID=A0A6N7Z9B9_9PSEU|nr:dihydrolipoamide acetyltransferase family protein [Amycolatopsis pithecellobii]MTD58330.1 2-oxo acid dehydrogenase subunit E2 [Amycolatopsis pithecellobii]
MPDFKQFLLADTAEGLTEAEILGVRVKPGDEVTVNQIVVEVETAKAAVELPIPWAGRITEVLVEEGQTVEVGAPILTVDVDPGGGSASVNGSAPDEEMKPLVGYGSKTVATKRRVRRGTPVPEPEPARRPEPAQPAPAAKSGYVPLAKPPVRKLAKDLGVDLSTLAGSVDGVITREDVERAAAPAPVVRQPGARERRVPIKGVRKATAQAMVSSAFTAPHVTEFLTVDVTPMMELRERLKKHPSFAGVKLTPLAFAAKAVCLAAKRTPDVNASWDEAAGEIVYKDYVHLGIAAATPRGLVVPKIRDADAMSLPELAVALDGLTTTAREGRTAPEDMVNGTITITNVGVFGVDTGTPIINPGEAAILAFGAIRDTPWVVDGELAVRKVLQLALSFDHRLVDGQQGSQFLADVGALLADPALAITY